MPINDKVESSKTRELSLHEQLTESLPQAWLNIQGSLFPWLAEELGSLLQKQQELATTLEIVRIEEFSSSTWFSLMSASRSHGHCPRVCGEKSVQSAHDPGVTGSATDRPRLKTGLWFRESKRCAG